MEQRLAPAPGPLVLSAIAIFGNQSFLGPMMKNPPRRAADIICANLNFPFTNFDTFAFLPKCSDVFRESHEAGVASTLISWAKNWKREKDAEMYLSSAMFFANRHTLAIASNYEAGTTKDYDTRSPRRLYTSEGYMTQKPDADLGPIILLAVLYSLQLIVLISFAIYIWKNPAWTNGLGSFSLSRIIANMERNDLEILARSQEGPDRARRMSEVGGFIGVSTENSDSPGGNAGTIRRLIPSDSGVVR